MKSVNYSWQSYSKNKKQMDFWGTVYFDNSKQLALSAVSWPGLGFPGSAMKALSSMSSPTAFFAFFGSFSSNAFV